MAAPPRQHRGVGPELSHRTVADLIMPVRSAGMADLRPALIRLKEQLRGVVAAGRPADETQRVIMLRGRLPQALLDRPDDLEDSHATHDLKLRCVERQLGRYHVKTRTDLRSTSSGPNESGVPGTAAQVPEPLLNALTALLAAVAKGKGKGKWG